MVEHLNFLFIVKYIRNKTPCLAHKKIYEYDSGAGIFGVQMKRHKFVKEFFLIFLRT